MMNSWTDILSAVLIVISAYFWGSVSFGYIIFRKKIGLDIRNFGSRATGASAILREMEARCGHKIAMKYWLLVFFLDAAKGAIPVAIALEKITNLYAHNGLSAGLALVLAIIGHIFPCPGFMPKPYFRGGKGVSTLVGATIPILLYYLPLLWTIIIIVFVIGSWYSVKKITKMASVSSSALVTALIVMSLVAWYKTGSVIILPLIFVMTGVIIVMIAHKDNWVRVWQGKERKT
jgi:acyl phosphate:glycerol-3-phosphate acyltransferase